MLLKWKLLVPLQAFHKSQTTTTSHEASLVTEQGTALTLAGLAFILMVNQGNLWFWSSREKQHFPHPSSGLLPCG